MMVYMVGTSMAVDGEAPLIEASAFIDAHAAWVAWQELQEVDHIPGTRFIIPDRHDPFAYGNPGASALYHHHGQVTYFLIPTTLIEERT